MTDDPDYIPNIVYMMAENNLDDFLTSDEAPEVVELLQDRLVEAVNQLEMPDDEDEAEEALRRTVLGLQVRAFLAGMYFRDAEISNQPTAGEEVMTVELDAEQKLELTRSLLNGDGISLKIL